MNVGKFASSLSDCRTGVLNAAVCTMSLSWFDFYQSLPGQLVMVSGSSCSGKSTAVAAAVRELHCNMVKSLTTRGPREGECEQEYGYISNDQASRLAEKQMVAWEVSVHGARYLTKKEDVIAGGLKRAGVHILNVTPNVPWEIPQEFFISGKIWPYFFISPGEDILYTRGVDRGDDPKAIARRIRECAHWNEWAQTQDRIPFSFIENDGTKAELEKRFIQNLVIRRL